MTLQVPFEDVAATAKRFAIKELYLDSDQGLCVLTGFNPQSSVVVVARTDQSEAQVREFLAKSSCEILRGVWSERPLSSATDGASMYVAAVGYQSGEHTPGVWMDAYEEEPTHVQVLEALYAEFRHTGELRDISIEEFIRDSNPNVVVVSQSQLKGFLEAKNDQAAPSR